MTVVGPRSPIKAQSTNYAPQTESYICKKNIVVYRFSSPEKAHNILRFSGERGFILILHNVEQSFQVKIDGVTVVEEPFTIPAGQAQPLGMNIEISGGSEGMLALDI